jgi:transcriptional regulator with XRE-family HTH domain
MEARDFVEALVKSGMTQSQIEARTGIAQPTISKILRGDVDDVLSKNYRKLEALYQEVTAAGPTDGGAGEGKSEAAKV